MKKLINYLYNISIINLVVNLFNNENHNIISDDGYKKLNSYDTT